MPYICHWAKQMDADSDLRIVWMGCANFISVVAESVSGMTDSPLAVQRMAHPGLVLAKMFGSCDVVYIAKKRQIHMYL